MSAKTLTEFGLVLYPGAQVSVVSGLTDLLVIANRFVLSDDEESAKEVRVSHWQATCPDSPPERIFDTHPEREGMPMVLVLPSVLGDPGGHALDDSTVAWLRERHATGTTLGSVCAGAFLLAQTGLLNGRTVTTHWLYAEPFRRQFGQVKLDVDRLVIDDGDIITAGGAMSWTDLGLKLLDRFLGPRVMLETSRILLIDPPGREQRYYSFFSPDMSHGDQAILKVQHWLHATAAQDMELNSMVAITGLEERTFLRRFRKATGMTTTEYCQRIRMGRARELLQFGQSSVESIAWEVGYHDVSAFSRVFTKLLGLTPGEYRHRFGSGRTLSRL